MVQAHTIPKEAAYRTVYAPGKPAVAPSVQLHGEVVSFSPELLTVKIDQEHIEVNIQKTQMWRMNAGRAWEAKNGEKVTITGDYIANGRLNARHIWLGLDNLFA